MGVFVHSRPAAVALPLSIHSWPTPKRATTLPRGKRRVERLAVGLPADDDVAGTGLGDGVDQRRFLGRARTQR